MKEKQKQAEDDDVVCVQSLVVEITGQERTANERKGRVHISARVVIKRLPLRLGALVAAAALCAPPPTSPHR